VIFSSFHPGELKSIIEYRGGRSATREQPPDQVGPLAEALRLVRSRGGKVGLDLHEHPRQRDGKRDERLVEIGGILHLLCLTVRLEMPLPAAGERRGLSTCRETGGLIRPRLRGLSRRTPDTAKVRLSRGRGHSRFGVESAEVDHAADYGPGQAQTGLTSPPHGASENPALWCNAGA
jgi:hypothetical protein